MSKAELLLQYKVDSENIRHRAKSLNLSDNEVNKIFSNCFEILKSRNVELECSNPKIYTKPKKCFCVSIKIIVCTILVGFHVYILLNVHQPTSSLVLRNVQGLIYPGLKIVRFLAVPFIRRFPSLTELYDRTCLLENPYFYVSDMECWPCENVHSVIDLSGFNNHSLYQSGIPYITQTSQKHVSFKNLQDLYNNHKDVFDKDSNSITSTNKSVNNIEDLFNYMPSTLKSSNTHFIWQINRMRPARILRTLFPRPDIVSEWSGQAMERYLMVDGPNATGYTLPNPECSYVFVVQGSGERTIILKPSKECGNQCKTVSIVLKPPFVLWYNWWYWRPISLPVENATEISISHISFYC